MNGNSSSNDQRLWLIARRTGRLANRLVLFANFMACAEEAGDRLANVAFHSYAHLFRTTRDDVYCRYPVTNQRSFFDRFPRFSQLIRDSRLMLHAVRVAQEVSERIPFLKKKMVSLHEIQGREVTRLDDADVRESVASANLIFGCGWRFRDPVAVELHAEKIRAFFRPVKEIERAIDDLIKPMRERSDILVGVHIRQGDYRKYLGGCYFFAVTRYSEWMQEFEALFPDQKVAFLVTSDEPRSKEEFLGLDVEVAPGPAVNDLYSLARCDYVIGPVSTFSQWASFYGNVPSRYLRSSEDCLSRDDFKVSFLDEIP